MDRAAGSSTEALRIQISAGVAYQNGQFSIDGGSGLVLTIPISLTLGPLQVRGVTLGLTPSTDEAQPPLTLELSATIVVTLSWFVLTVDRLGLHINTTALDLELTSKGVGLAINADCVSGGGFLFFDHTSHTYAGVFDVTINGWLSLKAVGLLTTQLNGQKIFSLLLIISATGLEIHLPLDFILTGVGILIGLDREINTTALEAGVKAHSLDNLMFPTDPIANAPAIVNSAAAAFPPSVGQTILGAMVQISWGAKQFARAELAVIYQWGHTRWVLLGKGRAFCPTEKNALLQIYVDFEGDYDSSAKRAFAYLSVNRTKIGGISLNGEAALLSEWGDNGTFIVSIGGFNTKYQPQVPPDFPSLKPAKITLKNSSVMKIEVTFYFAYTPNSTQVGGSISATLKAGKFGVEGAFSVDAVFQDQEPTFVFDLRGKLELKAWDVTLFLVSVEGLFEGWSPRHCRAKATFEIFIFSHTFQIDERWGDTSQVVQESAVDVNALFVAALTDRGSWNADLPVNAQSLVTLKSATAQTLHPLGTIRVLQRVVPLGLELERYGNGPISGNNVFQIAGVNVAGVAIPVTRLQEQFARSQYFNMSDDERLASPAFEHMDAGVQVPPAPLSASRGVAATTQYKTLIYNPDTKQAEPDVPYVMPLDRLILFATKSPAAKAANTRGGKVRFKGTVNPVRVGKLTFAIASSADLSVASIPGTAAGEATSFSSATQALRQHLRTNPADRFNLQVLAVTGQKGS